MLSWSSLSYEVFSSLYMLVVLSAGMNALVDERIVLISCCNCCWNGSDIFRNSILLTMLKTSFSKCFMFAITRGHFLDRNPNLSLLLSLLVGLS